MRKFIFFKGFTQEWFSSRTVNGQTRTLRAVWSPEFAEELNAFHAIDAEEEITRILNENLTQTVAAEIDRNILELLRNYAESEVAHSDTDEITRRINGGNIA
jgi:hypothetical protein